MIFLVSRSHFCHIGAVDLKVGRYRDSAVGIATDYGLDVRMVRIFSSPYRLGLLWGPPSLLSIGFRGLFPRRYSGLGCGVDHSPPASAEIKKSPIRLHGLVLN
jgi:hypothetical protein